MERLKIMTALIAIVIFSALLMSCSGGGSSQSDVPGLSTKAGSDQGRGGGRDDNPGHSDDPGSDDDDNPGHSGHRGRDGDNDDHAGGPNDTADIPVSTAVNSQQASTMAFVPSQSQFLVVWNDLRNRNNFDYNGWAVYGQFVNSSGGFQGNNFALSPLGVEYRTPPLAAHDVAIGRSLVVWGTTGGDILGQMINNDGTFFGNVIPIASTNTYEGIPALAFDPTQGRFLVAWLGLTNDYPIYGQLISHEGVLEGTSFIISDVSSAKLELKAVSDTQGGRFLIAWRDYRGIDIYSIRGQMVNSNGALQGSEITIADALGSQIFPDLVYDSENRCFLVTWSDDRRFGGSAYEIYGQLIAADGVPMGSNFLISPYGGYAHAVSFDPSTTHYFLTFPKFGNRIHGQYIAADGVVQDEAIALSDLEGVQEAPHLAYDSSSRRFLATWTDHRNGSRDIYGHTTSITVSSDPCDGQNDHVVEGCLSETDADNQVNAICDPNLNWANHGEYVSCVAKEVRRLREARSMSAKSALQLVNEAAHSDVGKNP